MADDLVVREFAERVAEYTHHGLDNFNLQVGALARAYLAVVAERDRIQEISERHLANREYQHNLANEKIAQLAAMTSGRVEERLAAMRLSIEHENNLSAMTAERDTSNGLQIMWKNRCAVEEAKRKLLEAQLTASEGALKRMQIELRKWVTGDNIPKLEAWIDEALAPVNEPSETAGEKGEMSVYGGPTWEDAELRSLRIAILHAEAERDDALWMLEREMEAHRETFDRLTRRCADLQQEINDRAAREEKLRKALELIWRDAEKYSGWWAMNEARVALAPTDTKEPGR